MGGGTTGTLTKSFNCTCAYSAGSSYVITITNPPTNSNYVPIVQFDTIAYNQYIAMIHANSTSTTTVTVTLYYYRGGTSNQMITDNNPLTNAFNFVIFGN